MTGTPSRKQQVSLCTTSYSASNFMRAVVRDVIPSRLAADNQGVHDPRRRLPEGDSSTLHTSMPTTFFESTSCGRQGNTYVLGVAGSATAVAGLGVPVRRARDALCCHICDSRVDSLGVSCISDRGAKPRLD